MRTEVYTLFSNMYYVMTTIIFLLCIDTTRVKQNMLTDKNRSYTLFLVTIEQHKIYYLFFPPLLPISYCQPFLMGVISVTNKDALILQVVFEGPLP